MLDMVLSAGKVLLLLLLLTCHPCCEQLQHQGLLCAAMACTVGTGNSNSDSGSGCHKTRPAAACL